MSLTPEEIEKMRQQVADLFDKPSEDTSDKGRERRYQREDAYEDPHKRFAKEERNQENRFRENSLTERLRRFQDEGRRRFEQQEHNRFQQEFDFSRSRGRGR